MLAPLGENDVRFAEPEESEQDFELGDRLCTGLGLLLGQDLKGWLGIRLFHQGAADASEGRGGEGRGWAEFSRTSTIQIRAYVQGSLMLSCFHMVRSKCRSMRDRVLSYGIFR
jgi:hypothetical protein